MLEANAADVAAAEHAGTTPALVDRLRSTCRLEGMAQSLVDLADILRRRDTVLEERPEACA